MSKKKDNKPQPTVQQLMNGETEGSLEGFVFDPAVCRRAFDHYDKDKSGYLDAKEIMKLADKLWDTFFPQGPKLSEANKKELVLEIISKTDQDSNKEVTYDEILPWFKNMNEKFWKMTHPKSEEEKARELAAASAAASAAATAEKSAEHSTPSKERSAPPKERSAPPPPDSLSSSPPGTASISGGAAGGGASASGGSPNKFGGLGSIGGYSSYTRPATSGAASELTLDLEALKAKIADLRSSVQGFAAALDTRLDMCLQSVKMHSMESVGESSNSGVV